MDVGSRMKSPEHRLDIGALVGFAPALAIGVSGAIFNLRGPRSMQIDYATAVDGRFKLGRTGFERSAIGFVSPEV